ncbi:MAG TPA: helix-turn-helix domain-containing protein [Solirubrobacterales bacterium]|nr:helix-turn-helix domain-containing protein [Solirubrobacterales bacterium]
MSAKQGARAGRSNRDAAATETDALHALSEAVESGAGLPGVARAAARALDGSVALIDRSSAVLAVAAASTADEQKLLSGAEGVATVELRVADAVVGELRFKRRRGARPDPVTSRMVSTLLALELERSRSPDWEADRLAGDFVRAVLSREVTDRGDIVARATEHGAEVDRGAGVMIARATPHSPQTGEWRERVLTLAIRALRAASRGSLATGRDADSAEVAAIVPCDGDEAMARAASILERELSASLPGFAITVARSRWTSDVVDLFRAGKEALLAANVGEAEGRDLIAFEETGAYRLLLPAMSEDPGELERFYEETVAPLVAYDDQYETELLRTIDAFLDNDGNVTPTAEELFTHRHTVRYRLERVRELSGHDIFSTEGRERLGLGLKAMRVLGISSPRGPATEPGTEAGQVRRPKED